MIVLGVIAAIVVVAVLAIVGVGGSGGSHAATTGTTGTTATTTGTTSGLHVNATISLTAPNPSSKAVGIVEVASAKGALGFVMAAEHLPPTEGFHYAAWLYDSPSKAVLLGEGPTVSSSGTLKAVGLLPSNASSYRMIILTEERSGKPTHPGPVVLSGAFKTK